MLVMLETELSVGTEGAHNVVWLLGVVKADSDACGK
jgi:hypothetical protein